MFRADSQMVRKVALTCALCAVMSLLTACGAADAPTTFAFRVTLVSSPEHLDAVIGHLLNWDFATRNFEAR